MANTTKLLAMANKIVLSNVTLQNKTAVAGIVRPDDGVVGLESVTIAGAGILAAEHSKINNEHIFKLADLDIKLDDGSFGLNHFVIQATFTADYNAGDTITIKNFNGKAEITDLICYNIYDDLNKKGQPAVTGSFAEGNSDLIEIYRSNGAAVINPRVAIWTA